MTYLIIGLALFFGPHLFSAFRSREAGSDLKARLGYGPYMGLYSLITGIGLGLIIYGFGASRPSAIIWTPPVWGAHLNYALMLVALTSLAASYLPTGHIKRTLKHPMLVAVKLWAVGHLLANGELNSMILFGSFLAYAVIDRIAVKKRGDLGPPKTAKISPLADLGAVLIGCAAYGLFVAWLHKLLIGVPVFS